MFILDHVLFVMSTYKAFAYFFFYDSHTNVYCKFVYMKYSHLSNKMCSISEEDNETSQTKGNHNKH